MQLALFDFDHTITTCDTYARFLRKVATPAQLAAAKWQVGPWVLGYRVGLISAQALRARVTRLVFSTRSLEEMTMHGAAYARNDLPGMLRTNVMQRIDWHQAQGHEVVLVSASLDLYLQPWCAQHDLSLICNRLEHHAGVLSGRYANGDCGPHKATQIRLRYDLSQYECVHAYGDSREDTPMLALAQRRWYRGYLLH
ncbi:HAD family hydrolase [Xanthomonas hortorum]|uniref:HAD family hydrolase n=1 Tax=Xanthomonas hortorum pv. pelargonii TaxID=453602 RepID=A0A6V7E049_9XANT|nr:HAD family hydrolase [Xanthomonas hortorum]MCE4354067.1 HAD-IB family hydrolase [Xanthomonas hortorum pv. pelargonii]MCM5523900.1 HAD-IB family hydrolase [Xanthomonas hortorum pv. pelargonii]MCM5536411.1 HAD-IB family hydrolase [Xanthomonas hortorum pv. pelargonii]MCM5540532.1 HAD-IB family hydrolase [Xanthomonas hortorum pv. pelargonii]MCM5545222.1 HAD-IB family hydrolase [Xanthomonas hortorum pv. pelargonii]